MRALITSALLCLARGQVHVGQKAGGHACMSSAGYSWCDASQTCVRTWETPCADNYADCAGCLARQKSGVNIACPVECDAISIGPGPPIRVVDRQPPAPRGPAMPRGCSVWFDGCNTCHVANHAAVACTEITCFALAGPSCPGYQAEGRER